MTAYYNEIDPFAAQWLRNLIKGEHIAPGEVDERSIADVRASDLDGYTQCHFFAGIGGWSYALRLAGWSDTRPVWSGSCPCQPFSAAGKGGGGADDRHLWPHWRRLIGECKPATIFGEQVAAAIGWGWLDAVCADLEAEGYATGSAVLGAHSVGAPHIRQRLWFVAQSASDGRDERRSQCEGQRRQPAPVDAGGDGLLADADRSGRQPGPHVGGGTGQGDGARGSRDKRQSGLGFAFGVVANACVLDLAAGTVEGRRAVVAAEQGGAQHRGAGELGDADRGRQFQRDAGVGTIPITDTPGASPWSDLVWLPCTDGKARPTQRTFQRMAAGVSDSLGYVRTGDGYTLSPLIQGGKSRVGRLRGYGNSINVQAGAAFIAAFMECRP